MNYLHTLYRRKLASLQAAAPRATLRAFHVADGFELYLNEAEAAHKGCSIGTFTNKAEDPDLDAPVYHLFIPLAEMPTFAESITGSHTLALVDCDSSGRHVAYAWFGRKREKEPSGDFWG